jgi:hypothetical protein
LLVSLPPHTGSASHPPKKNVLTFARLPAPAQGILAQIRILGGSIAIAASSAILGQQIHSQLAGIVPPEQLNNLAAAAVSLTEAQAAAVRQAYADAFTLDMKVSAGMAAVGLVMALGVYRKNRLTVAEQRAEHIREENERRRAKKALGSNPLA